MQQLLFIPGFQGLSPDQKKKKRSKAFYLINRTHYRVTANQRLKIGKGELTPPIADVFIMQTQTINKQKSPILPASTETPVSKSSISRDTEGRETDRKDASWQWITVVLSCPHAATATSFSNNVWSNVVNPVLKASVRSYVFLLLAWNKQVTHAATPVRDH